jgi:hypothetical protein
MSSNARRQQRRKELEQEAEYRLSLRIKEECRKEALSMWERIEEADTSADVKDILHRLAQKLGMED